MDDIQIIVSRFVDASINYGIAQEEGNANKVNKFVRKIEKASKELKERNEIENPSFIALLNHSNDYVKFHAAFSLLRVNDDLSKPILLELSKKNGLIGFEAKMSLSEYEKGNI